MPAKKTTPKKLTKDQIISAYMQHVLENDAKPLTVYSFCKANKFTESEFYNFFGSFKSVREGIWIAFYDNTIKALHATADYETYAVKDKMLAFFYTMFENLTANRSYVLATMSEHKQMLEKMEQLKGLRKHIKSFAAELIEEGNDSKNYKITKNPVRIFSEGAWIQFVFLLKYWMDDNSPAFEKTDVAIEKSVHAIFDVFETTPLESILDFGKFLIKDKFAFAK